MSPVGLPTFIVSRREYELIASPSRGVGKTHRERAG